MRSTETIQIRIPVAGVQQEIIAAAMGSLAVDAFLNDDDALSAYFEPSAWTDASRDYLRSLLNRFGVTETWEELRIAPKNWNQIWESGFRALVVEPFLIRPTWDESTGADEHLLQIVVDPKMSFGTGHHETTRLMLRHLGARRDRLSRVLDAGTGTGILAIAAAMLGANWILAYDVDEWCMTNARENAKINGVESRIHLHRGTLDDVVDEGFSLILANINRNVLLSDLPGFVRRLAPGGVVVLSGVLTSDRRVMLNALTELGFEGAEERSEGEWWSVAAEKARSAP